MKVIREESNNIPHRPDRANSFIPAQATLLDLCCSDNYGNSLAWREMKVHKSNSYLAAFRLLGKIIINSY